MLDFNYSALLKALILVGWAISFNGFSQIEVVPIERHFATGNENKAARTGSLPAQALPFWDDFSVLNTNPNDIYYPLTTVWQNGRSVWVNSGTGINPPSLNVATFDGYDYLGKPYAINNVLATGLADTLTSGALKLGDVPASERSTVFISFFYQFAGNGDAPEPGDAFSLLFKNAAGQWRQVWSIENNNLLKPDEFVQEILPITGDEYFHNDFQFRFQNFGRLSGPFDTWNLDYIYINKGRSSTDNSYPDRALTLPVSSIFKQYNAIPIKHLNASSFVKPRYFANNLKVAPQNITSFSSAVLFTYQAGLSTETNIKLDSAVSFIFFRPFERGEAETAESIQPTDLNLNADSILVNYKLGISTKDNVNVGTGDGDYLPNVFTPIDFRNNDRTARSFMISNYYSYDDGVAEYGANITGSGTQLAYQFDMATNEQDTIIAVDLFFPKFGDESNQLINLHVMGGLTGNQSDYLYEQDIAVQRTNRNDKKIFKRISISTGVAVKNTFYVGWKLTSPAQIPIGLDASNDSGDKIFVNSTGSWIQNKTLKGNLMIRPVFGKPKNVTTSLAAETQTKPYPNPTSRNFFLPASAENIQLFDSTGKSVAFEQNQLLDKKEVTISNPSIGLYLVRYFDKAWHTEKIMVAL